MNASVPRKRWRKVLGAAGLLVYLLLLVFNLFAGTNKGSSWNVRAELLEAPFEIWFVGSVLGFFIIVLLWSVDRLAREHQPRGAAGAHEPRQERGLHALIGDGLTMLQRHPETLGIELDRGVEVLDRNADVVNCLKHGEAV